MTNIYYKENQPEITTKLRNSSIKEILFWTNFEISQTFSTLLFSINVSADHGLFCLLEEDSHLSNTPSPEKLQVNVTDEDVKVTSFSDKDKDIDALSETYGLEDLTRWKFSKGLGSVSLRVVSLDVRQHARRKSVLLIDLRFILKAASLAT